eukprot:comp6263_c0_seq1/m.2082 comp6263_c0_seq1/g.2082  ORF comp6263_c0_seq1/g.2082 comp6263_c0_seq1/m.2082 type:complete len:365 (-) comp6263_c0_seq1:610-1704(-)
MSLRLSPTASRRVSVVKASMDQLTRKQIITFVVGAVAFSAMCVGVYLWTTNTERTIIQFTSPLPLVAPTGATLASLKPQCRVDENGFAPWSEQYRLHAGWAVKKWKEELPMRLMKEYNGYNQAPGVFPSISLWDSHYVGAGINEPPGHRRFDLFNPYLPCPSGQLKKMGTLEGGKWICTDLLEKEPCLIYSLGSNNEFSFEEVMLANTPCEMHTFDCTSTPKVLSPKHHFHSICIGDLKQSTSDRKFMPLDDIKKMLNHPKIDLLKMDIEAFEFDVFAGWSPEMVNSLPLQLSFEMHYWPIYAGTSLRKSHSTETLVYPRRQLSLGEMALYMSRLADFGYGIMSREDGNYWCPGCCELTLIRTI